MKQKEYMAMTMQHCIQLTTKPKSYHLINKTSSLTANTNREKNK